MISIFTPVPNDSSIYYLSMIFGPMNGLLGEVGVGSQSLLGAMFNTFNSIVLAVGALIVVYITVMAVMSSAHEGQFMGKKFHGLWTPIRVVIGIAAMIPTSSGFSGLQIVMMWVIVQGVGAADTLWSNTVNHLVQTGSPYPVVTTADTYQTMTSLFQGMLCDASAHRTEAAPDGLIPDGNYFCRNNPTDGFCRSGARSTAFTPGRGEYILGPNGVCGTLKFCDTSQCTDQTQLRCQVCKSQEEALTKVVDLFATIAIQFAADDYAYRDFYVKSNSEEFDSSKWVLVKNFCQNPRQGITLTNDAQNNCCARSISSDPQANAFCSPSAPSFPFANAVEGSQKNERTISADAVKQIIWPYSIQKLIGVDGDLIGAGTGEYSGEITKTITKYIDAQALLNQGGPPAPLLQSVSYGWIFAGTYYYQIAKMNNNNMKNSMPTLEFTLDTSIQLAGRNNSKGVEALITLMREDSNANKRTSTAGPAAGGPQYVRLGRGWPLELRALALPISLSVQAVDDALNATLRSNNVDPISSLQSFGRGMIETAEIMYGVILGIIFLAIFLGSIFGGVMGNFITNPLGPAASVAFFVIFPAVLALVALLISMGATLAIYVPLIPYILFTLGALGWMTSVIEAMVAGPLVALGILSPGGQHELLGKAEGSLMLLFNIFLRPTLMIFGLLAAMLLARVAITMINGAFSEVQATLMGSFDIVMWVLFIVAYVMLIVSALNKCFALIHVIPEKVMRWIGGQGEQYGEDAALQKVEGGVGAGAGKIGQAGSGSLEAAQQTKKILDGSKKKPPPSAGNITGGGT